ncbi:nitrate reductase cytochrome c-type subunit [Candidatus Magnetaquicoccus inordinatus]|uniref:nitrate reductase cytochrome c-type subunit n=1 Tax=Candidatus Magnetaquicoccus inordinatus TaxID=2496818 RepID=UPI001D0E572F|nr:nitrate reductase cytochrome c-type subunit [Candidatus Magnetaquicoccus inordinatus]
MMVILACAGITPAQAGDVTGLRGGVPLDGAERSPELTKWMPDSHALPRAYLQQPPLVPHQIESYKIDMRQNKCMTCHSWSKAKETRATKISLTHFRNRFGSEMSDVSPQRYFCTQCHVPQKDAPPLVENTFKPVEAIK